MFEWLRPDVELVTDLTPAEWFSSTLEPWPSGGQVIRLASFMPDGFECYVRIFHPFMKTIFPMPTTFHRWSEVAGIRGVAISAESSAEEVAGDEWGATGGDLPWAEGEIPEEACPFLVEILLAATTSAAACWFALWSGWGNLHGPGIVPSIPGPTAEQERENQGRQRQTEAALDAIPQIRLHAFTGGRSYLLFRGPVDAACSFDTGRGSVSPSFWWPDDRAWAVVTEIDGTSTYVGGSRATIDAILSSEDLEAIEASRDVRLG